MAEYFGPWLPSAYFAGGYWQQGGGTGSEVVGSVTIVCANSFTVSGGRLATQQGGRHWRIRVPTTFPVKRPVIARPVQVAVSARVICASNVQARATAERGATVRAGGASGMMVRGSVAPSMAPQDNDFWLIAA
jgi:hypothetical protein